MRGVWMWCLVAAVGVTSPGCMRMNGTRHGAITGAGLGAVAGTLVGAATGNPKTGLVVGTLLGGAAGASMGHAEDVAYRQAVDLEAMNEFERQRYYHDRALTEGDIVRMVQSGCSDQLIVSTLRDRGGRFQLAPDTIIMLKQQGVSDPVIEAMQLHNLWR